METKLTRHDLKRLSVEKSIHYQVLKNTKKWMDDYYLDGFIGLIPVVGDIATQIFNYSFLYVSAVKIKSYRLTMAILFNVLIDILIGLIPYLGTILDFLHRSYKENFDLIIGFVENNPKIVQKVTKNAVLMTISCVILIIIIILLIWLITKFFKWIFL